MKTFTSYLAIFLSDRSFRGDLRVLIRHVLFVVALVSVYAALFHVLMVSVEGQQHSWFTGFYWTLVVMTTLGFGDITFHTDIGRAFSLLVLISGLFLLLVVLPFIFVRHFYAPWLEAQVRLRIPRGLAPDVRGHVIVVRHGDLAQGLVERLLVERLRCVILEPDHSRAAALIEAGLDVVCGDVESRATYEAVGVDRARLIVANAEDTTNTNVTLTVREVAPNVPIVAIVTDEDSEDILQLAGCSHVLPLKRLLGDYLANRVNAARAEAHVIGSYRTLQIVELPARDTPLVGLLVSETRLRETMQVNIIGIWERGRLKPAYPQTRILEDSVVVLVGDAQQITRLNALLPNARGSEAPVLIIGGGKVGFAAARALHGKGIPVHVLDRLPERGGRLEGIATRFVVGDGADRQALSRAGLEEASSVLLTTNDDAINIYLAVYCRKLRPKLRIVSRVSHDRNVEAIHRAGADFALSYASLGVEALVSILGGYDPVILGEGVDLVVVPVPESLAGKTLAETGIGSQTGLSVVAIQRGDEITTELGGSTRLESGTDLVMLGSVDQQKKFTASFGTRRAR